MYRGNNSKSTDDYHKEMCWEIFSDWCVKKVFPAIRKTGRKSVLVLDRATYQTHLLDEDRKPSTQWRKSRLIESIKKWGGPDKSWSKNWEKEKSNRQLLEYCRSIYPTPKYAIQKLADQFEEGEFCIKILFLPVAHPELNPIEIFGV